MQKCFPKDGGLIYSSRHPWEESVVFGKLGYDVKKYRVFLFKSPNCIRGWLAYIDTPMCDRATFAVDLDAESAQKAKNAAITAANNGFTGVEIVQRNHTDEIWGINNFTELAGR